MKQYDPTEIIEILECSYYDMRTDYVWQYVLGNNRNQVQDYFCIPSLESFMAMSEMLKCRKNDVRTFMEEWENTEHPGLTECTYCQRSGILRLKSRTFSFVYRSKTHEYHYSAYAAVAKRCWLKKRQTHKRYVKGGLFPIAYLVELDEQLYSRYDAALRLEAWRKSPQSELDIQYCSAMLPTIMQNAETKKHLLNRWQRLNIILEGNDRVRIGIVEMYSPEEMQALPSFLRADWQQGIIQAFERQENEYNETMNRIREEMTELSQELTQIIRGKAPYDAKSLRNYYYNDIYTNMLLHEAIDEDLRKEKWQHQQEFFQPIITYLGGNNRSKKLNRFETDTFIYEADATGNNATIEMKDEALATVLNIDRVSQLENVKDYHVTPAMLDKYNEYLKSKLIEYQTCYAERQRPRHALLVEELNHIIQVTAPLFTYMGDNETIRENYNLKWDITEDDKIMVQISFRGRAVRQYFSFDDYKSRFRVWWSQLLLNECKLTKDASRNPEILLNSDRPF